ncbi:hypothetical protein SAMN04244553_2686 [Nocardia amikacinitolerans]|uniref:Uncharacterized protein n=1 Tax=Nocardia amikacinitolerans TaxID=756689 RepID=A0A285LBX8_9NOCA|nr:hypothetical protein SAMN04244553_2686 [Nocardia amikacinitolerans]
MPDRFRTKTQVLEYLAVILGPNREFRILETEHGWVCRPVLNQEEIESGQGLGLGNYVVNKQTGVVTEHRSLPPRLIGQEYEAAIQAGQPIPGIQVYPPTWRVHLERNWETAAEIEYRVQAESLTRPSQPPIDHQLTINKRNHHYYTNTEAIHVTCREAAGWAQARSQTGAWPETGTFEF